MKVARAKGRLRDKKPKLSPRQEAHLVALHHAGTHTSAELAELFFIARSTVYRAIEGPPSIRSGGKATNPLRWHAQRGGQLRAHRRHRYPVCADNCFPGRPPPKRVRSNGQPLVQHTEIRAHRRCTVSGGTRFRLLKTLGPLTRPKFGGQRRLLRRCRGEYPIHRVATVLRPVLRGQVGVVTQYVDDSANFGVVETPHRAYGFLTHHRVEMKHDQIGYRNGMKYDVRAQLRLTKGIDDDGVVRMVQVDVQPALDQPFGQVTRRAVHKIAVARVVRPNVGHRPLLEKGADVYASRRIDRLIGPQLASPPRAARIAAW